MKDFSLKGVDYGDAAKGALITTGCMAGGKIIGEMVGKPLHLGVALGGGIALLGFGFEDEAQAFFAGAALANPQTKSFGASGLDGIDGLTDAFKRGKTAVGGVLDSLMLGQFADKLNLRGIEYVPYDEQIVGYDTVPGGNMYETRELNGASVVGALENMYEVRELSGVSVV